MIDIHTMKLLLVDDHILFREGLAAIIGREPDIQIVGLGGNVQEAIQLAGREKPDVVLMDFGLPDGTGADATRQILKERPDCKIVFLTMSEQDEDLLEAIRSGAKGYLLKNMSPSKLVAALRAVYQGESAISRSMTLRLMDELTRTKASTQPPVDLSVGNLTPREIDVLREMATGITNLEIGRRLFLSENTVKYHVHSILQKLDLNDRKAATKFAVEHGLTNKD